MIHLRRQILWLTLIPLLFLTACVEAYFLHDSYRDIDQKLIDRARNIAEQLVTAKQHGEEILHKQIAQAMQLPDVQAISLLDGEGKELFSQENQVADHPERHLTRKEFRIYAPLYDIATASPAHEQGIVVEMNSANAELQKLQILVWSLLVVVIFLSVVIYFLSRASNQLIAPINRFRTELQNLITKNYDFKQSDINTNVCELESLAENINNLVKNFQKQQESLQRKIVQETQLLIGQKELAERNSLNSSRFLAVASHELRQPLHALSLYINELQRKVNGSEQQHLVGQINHSVEILTEMLNSLLDISKLDARTIIPQIQTCSMSDLLERVSANHVMLARIKNVRLVVRPCTCHVSGDPVLLERIIMNLVSNAIRYTNPGGSVLVACRNRSSYIHLEVRDNGIGIDPEDQENIFREFHQCKQSQLDNRKGLGLGLAIVDRLTKLLGYRLSVRSKPGIGSVFSLQIPTASQSGNTTSHSVQVTPATHINRKKILVVDDDPLVLESTVHILSAWGCDVSFADSLGSVTARLDEGEHWDLVITDYQLEDHITGLNIINTVNQKLSHKVPCILITGNTSQELSKLINAGGGHVLYKPVRPAKLRSLVEFLLKEGIPE